MPQVKGEIVKNEVLDLLKAYVAESNRTHWDHCSIVMVRHPSTACFDFVGTAGTDAAALETIANLILKIKSQTTPQDNFNALLTPSKKLWTSSLRSETAGLPFGFHRP